MRGRTVAVQHFLCCCASCAGGAIYCRRRCEGYGVHEQSEAEEGGAEEAREAGESAGYPPGERGGGETDLGNAVRRRRGHRFETEEQPCKDDGSYRCSVRIVRIDSLGGLNRNHVPDDENYGQSYFRY